MNSCNGTLNVTEKAVSVQWNAFNVEMDQPISHCISQCAIQIHLSEIKMEYVRKTPSFIAALYPTLRQSGKSICSLGMTRYTQTLWRQSGGYKWMLDTYEVVRFKCLTIQDHLCLLGVLYTHVCPWQPACGHWQFHDMKSFNSIFKAYSG